MKSLLLMGAVIVIFSENVACVKFRITELKSEKVDLLDKITVLLTEQSFLHPYFLNFLYKRICAIEIYLQQMGLPHWSGQNMGTCTLVMSGMVKWGNSL